MSSPPAAVVEAPLVVPQKPRLRILPPCQTDETGKDAIRYAAGFGGMDLFPWQKYAVIDTLRERWVEDPLEEEGGLYRWAATDVGILVARQNGKGDVLICIALYCLLVLKVRRIFWTAQLQKTATDAHKRMAAIIRSSPELESQLAPRGIKTGKGDERIVTNWGTEILFFTRSDDAGRGLFGDVLICDEAYDLTDGELAALRPLLKTSRNPLVIYTSTPVDGDVHPNGVVLSRVRKRALAGRTPRLTWLEWSVPPWDIKELGPDPRTWDPEYLARGNPSLTYLFGLETLEDDLTSMGRRKFLVEDLCAPDYWPDPDADEIEDVPFPDTQTFRQQAKPDAVMLDPVALGIDRSPDGWTTLAAAGWFPDGTWGSETIRHVKGDPEWVFGALAELVDEYAPAVLVVDAAGPAGSLITKLRQLGFDPVVTGVQEMGQACQAYVDDYDAGTYFHRGADLPLLAAAEVVRWRTLGDARAFARKGYGDISPVVAAALAGHGLRVAVVFGKPKRPAEAMTPVPLGPSADGGADWGAAGDDMASVGF